MRAIHLDSGAMSAAVTTLSISQRIGLTMPIERGNNPAFTH
jgi:hypothetical protein